MRALRVSWSSIYIYFNSFLIYTYVDLDSVCLYLWEFLKGPEPKPESSLGHGWCVGISSKPETYTHKNGITPTDNYTFIISNNVSRLVFSIRSKCCQVKCVSNSKQVCLTELKQQQQTTKKRLPGCHSRKTPKLAWTWFLLLLLFCTSDSILPEL